MAGNRWAQQIVADLRKVMKLNRHHSLFKQGRLADSLAGRAPRADGRPAHRAGRRAGPKKIADAIGLPENSTAQAIDALPEALRLLHGHRRQRWSRSTR
jgi:hypothetical protein